MNYIQMIIIMIISGILSSMYVWSDKLSDVRFSINDIYMIGLMTAWMCLFMALLHKDMNIVLISGIIVLTFYYCIRNQIFISKQQYYTGMIPHHSMALLMSKRLLENDKTLMKDEKEFVKNIISSQTKEIEWMKYIGS